MRKETIQNGQKKEPLVPLPYSRFQTKQREGEFKAKVALEEVRH